MSIQAIAKVLDLEDDRLTPSLAMILIGIANHVTPNGQCYPGVKRLMRYSKCGESTVRAGIRQLEQLGFIKVVRRKGTSSLYYLTLPLQNLEDPPPDIGGPPLQDLDPNHKSNHKSSTSDARVIGSDWKPSPDKVIRLPAGFEDIDLDHQVEQFIAYNMAKGTVHKDPDAAFQAWVLRVAELKVPPKRRAAAARVGPVDPAAAARQLERDAKTEALKGQIEHAVEGMLRAADAYLKLGQTDDARRCAEAARSNSRSGSWHRETADKFIKERLA